MTSYERQDSTSGGVFPLWYLTARVCRIYGSLDPALIPRET